MSALRPVSFARLVARLYARGVTYRATADGRLHVEAPAGALTSGDWAAIAAHKDDLLFLCSGGVTVYGRGREPAWLREELTRTVRDAGVQAARDRVPRRALTEARP